MSAPRPSAAPFPPGALAPGTPLLLATACSADSRPATRVALALAAERGLAPHVLRVHDVPALDVAALGLPAYPADPFAAGVPYDEATAAVDAAQLRAELAAAGMPTGAPWPVRVEVGAPSACIVREAARVGAGLVVVGLRARGLADRALGDNTAARVMRDAPCPVLGVSAAAPALAGLPRRVLVGVDFGRASARAAHAALALVADGGTLVLAHVAAPSAQAAGEAPPESDEGEALVHALGVDAAFERLVTELGAATPAGRSVAVECLAVPCVPGHGVARELLAAAGRVRADLVAAATQRLPRLARLLLGSVTAELARDGGRSLLVVPPAGRGA